MALSAPVKGFIIALLSAIGAFAVYFIFLAKKNSYLIDNPTSQTFYYTLNNKDGIIGAGQSIPVDLAKGENRISVKDDSKKIIFDTVFQVSKERGLLNVAHQDYYINTQYYGYNLNKDSLITRLGTTEIDGKTYLGAPEKFSGFYTENFYYNVDEDYDKVIKNIQKVESRSKIFRKQDFLIYYNSYYKK